MKIEKHYGAVVQHTGWKITIRGIQIHKGVNYEMDFDYNFFTLDKDEAIRLAKDQHKKRGLLFVEDQIEDQIEDKTGDKTEEKQADEMPLFDIEDLK